MPFALIALVNVKLPLMSNKLVATRAHVVLGWLGSAEARTYPGDPGGPPVTWRTRLAPARLTPEMAGWDAEDTTEIWPVDGSVRQRSHGPGDGTTLLKFP